MCGKAFFCVHVHVCRHTHACPHACTHSHSHHTYACPSPTHTHTCAHQLPWDQILTPHVAAVWLQPRTTRHTVLRLLHPFTPPPWGSSHDVTLLPDLKPPLSCGQTFYPGRGPGPYLTTSPLPAQTAEHPGGLPGPTCPRCCDPRLPRSRRFLGLQASSSHGPQPAQPCPARAC